MPKLKGIPFEPASIERYRRRECSVEEVLIEIIWPGCLFGGLKILQKSYGAQKVSPGTISNLNKKAYVHSEEWCNRELKNNEYHGFRKGVIHYARHIS